jgi:low affinity Fe/Cu permease
MLIVCVLLAAGSVAAYASHQSLLIDGTNLAINVLTLLFLPILQATQNRDGAALQAKLDELIKANKGANSQLIGLEERSEEEIEQLRPVAESVTDPDPTKTEPVG